MITPSDYSDDVNVLVVDDQPANVSVLDALLPRETCRLVWAASADAALLELLERDFAAIILDVQMPGMNGLELATLIKQRRRTRDVPILFLTAHMLDERDMLRGYGTGAVDYLTKPIHPDVLRSKLAVFVELYRKGRTLEQLNRSLQREVAQRELAEETLRLVNQDLERRVVERTDALVKADQRKDAFLAVLAHELRNPLAPIRSAIEILQNGASEDQAARAHASLRRQVSQMTRLIDDLLDVSRITSDKLVLRPGAVELRDVVATALETTAPLMTERGHELSIDLPGEPVELVADPVRLSQVLSNLLANAAKFTAPGGRIELAARADADGLTIRVRDNGPGIDAEVLPHIFEMFRQGGDGRSSGGLGIGLTLARRIVELHGGRLDVVSGGPGQGAEFSVVLPMTETRRNETPDAGDSQTPDLGVARRILVVDDNQDSSEMTAVLLSMWGQNPRVAFDGPEALAAARSFRPEIVLLDIGLPGLDGYEVARRLRSEPWGKELLLVAVTGWGQASDMQRTREGGFDHHLVKPIAPEQLRNIIAEYRAPSSP
jgi:signal transduction histidine kinase